AAVHVVLLVKKMHRTAQPARAARLFAKQFRHARIGGCASSERVGVITVCRNDIIIIAYSGHRACYDCFLPNVEMAKPANLLRLVLLAGAFFKPPDQQHQREHLDFVALLRRLHGGHAVRGTAARTRELSALRPRLMQTTKRMVNKRSLASELRKNIQL